MNSFFEMIDGRRIVPCSLLAVLAIVAPCPAGEPEAASLVEAGRYREAVAILEKTSATPDGYPGARVLLGRAYLGLGRYAEAETVLSAPVAGADDPGRLEALARIAEARGDLDRALQLMAQAVEAKQKSLASAETPDGASALAEYRTRHGELAFRAGRLDLAREQFQKAIALVNAAHAKLHELGVPHDEKDPRLFAGGATAGLARVYAAQGDDRRAERTWRGVAARTDDPAVLASLGAFCLARDDERSARRHFDRVVRLAEGKPGHRRTLALLLADRREKFDEVLALAEAAYRDGPDVLARDTLAWILHRRGEHARASEILRPALEAGTQDPLVLYHAGMIDHALGRTEEAKRLLSRSLAINPAFDPVAARDARRALDRLR